MKSKNIIIVLLSFIGGVYVQADNLFEWNPHWRLEDMEAHWKGRWYDVGDPEEVNGKIYFRFSSVRLNRLRNKLLANYLKSGGNELATVRISAFCVAMLSNNSFICKYSIFFRKYELSAAVL